MSDDEHDIHQMGGEVLLTEDGTVQWMHVTQESTDRPSADEILTQIKAH